MKPFLPEDLGLFQDLGQLHVSTGGNFAACIVRSVNLGADDYASTVWRFALDGSEARAFTAASGNDSAPRWSPDGAQLAFISTRSGTPQVHLLPADGGEARVLSRLKEGAAAAEWSPQGDRLLVTGAVSIDVESREQLQDAAEPPPVGAPELAWRLPFKSDGAGFLLRRLFRMFVVDAETGEHTPLAHGPFDVLSAAWSPDGRRVVFVRTQEGKQAHRTDAWMVDADGGNLKQLTAELAATMSPRFSPDGRWIALCGAREEGDAQTRLFLYEVATGRLSQLGDDDVEIASHDSVQWSEDSMRLFAIVATHACQHVVAIDARSGAMTTLVGGERHISELRVGAGRLVYFAESPSAPRELFTADLDGSGERQLSFLNGWWWERTPLTAEIRKFVVPDGAGGEETIEGWLVRAKDWKGPSPTLIEAHGGPNAFALLGFPWNTYWNVLCSRGWAIVVPHAVGSISFGRAFAERLNGHWGELDFPQFMAVVDALQRDGIADARVAIAGKSYGGYMSAWAIGHTDRFKAAIVAAPVANLESHYGTSDGGYYSQPYTLSGERHIKSERYRALSPVTHIHHCTTPTLLLQGKDDERCPRGQAEELFAVLVRTGNAAVEMVMYPGGDHHFYETGKPSHRLDVVRRMMGWMQRWVAEAPVGER